MMFHELRAHYQHIQLESFRDHNSQSDTVLYQTGFAVVHVSLMTVLSGRKMSGPCAYKLDLRHACTFSILASLDSVGEQKSQSRRRLSPDELMFAMGNDEISHAHLDCIAFGKNHPSGGAPRSAGRYATTPFVERRRPRVNLPGQVDCRGLGSLNGQRTSNRANICGQVPLH